MQTLTKVLVTGSQGKIGRLLVEKLLRLGRYEVVGTARTPRAAAVRTIELDLSRLDHVAEVVAAEAPSVVVHLAALTGPQADPAMLRHINVDLVDALARAAGNAGTGRFVYASSSAVYGDRFDAPVSELDSLDPLSAYAESKVEAENALRAVAASGLSAVALRIFNVYGQGFNDSLVNRLQLSSAPHPVTLRGWDTFVRDYVDAADVADAIVAGMEQSLLHSFSVINVGTGQPTSNGRLVDLVGRSQPVFYELEPARPSYSCADITLARELLGVVPRPLHQLLG